MSVPTSSAATGYRIGIDVGGTFTDLVAIDDHGRITVAKSASTPRDQSIGVLAGLELLAGSLGIDRAALLGSTERIVHGTTVATNALLERKGAKTGLLTTEGHRDVLEMREGLKDDRYALRQPAPDPLVPRHLRLPVRERVRADGTATMPLERGSLSRAIRALSAEQVEAVAVCYLHAWRSPDHERATAEALARALPAAYVSLSSDVFPQIKEFERVCTTVVNAYVGPVLERYLERLVERLAGAGYAGPVLIMQSHGGLATVVDAVRLATGGVLSGPAGGVAAARHASRILEHGNLIAFDMGGTSTDMSLIVEGEAAVSTDRRVAGHRVALHSLDIASIGAGGGSIAHVDAGGVLHVGPASAGADPGPACYGKGGTAPTVTDANLVLGFLDPERFLGGRQRLDAEAAARAVDTIATRLGIDRMAAAEGIHRIVNTHMAEGIRLVSVRRGVDPRRFALLSFGGAAGVHVTAVARQLDLTRVVVPRLAPVFSAWGMLASDLRYEIVRTHIGDASALDAGSLDALYKEMEAQGARAARRRRVRWRDRLPPKRGHALRRADLRGRGAARPHRLVGARPHRRHRRCVPCPPRGVVHVLAPRPGGGAGQRASRRGRPVAGGPGRTGARTRLADCTRRCSPRAPGYLAEAGRLPARHPGARAAHRGSRHRRVGSHHGAAAHGRRRACHSARLAGYRHRREVIRSPRPPACTEVPQNSHDRGDPHTPPVM